MVKGISRQVIVVHAPEPRLFEQAIFILNENAQEGITDDALLKEAEKAIHLGSRAERQHRLFYYGAFWAGLGAAAVGLLWAASAIL